MELTTAKSMVAWAKGLEEPQRTNELEKADRRLEAAEAALAARRPLATQLRAAQDRLRHRQKVTEAAVKALTDLKEAAAVAEAELVAAATAQEEAEGELKDTQLAVDRERFAAAGIATPDPAAALHAQKCAYLADQLTQRLAAAQDAASSSILQDLILGLNLLPGAPSLAPPGQKEAPATPDPLGIAAERDGLPAAPKTPPPEEGTKSEAESTQGTDAPTPPLPPTAVDPPATAAEDAAVATPVEQEEILAQTSASQEAQAVRDKALADSREKRRVAALAAQEGEAKGTAGPPTSEPRGTDGAQQTSIATPPSTPRALRGEETGKGHTPAGKGGGKKAKEARARSPSVQHEEPGTKNPRAEETGMQD